MFAWLEMMFEHNNNFYSDDRLFYLVMF